MKADAMIAGIQPRRGMRLVNRARGRVYGTVDHVKNDGTLVWVSAASGALVKSDPERLRMDGVTYEESAG